MTDPSQPVRILDSHVHYISPDRFVYPWLEQFPVLRRPALSGHFRQASLGAPVTKLVVVEASADLVHCVDEAAWIADLVADEPRLAGIVARVPLADPVRRNRVLDRLAAIQLVRGVRDIIQWEAPGYCSQPEYLAGARELGRRGLVCELCIFHPQLAEVVELVRACPEVRFVLDHCGKPGIRARLWQPWAGHLRELADRPNVVCKISALLTEADPAAWTAAEIHPYIDQAIACFGTDRLLFGGDWPVCTLAGPWSAWYALTCTAVAAWSPAERDAFFYGNAARTYGITT